MTDLQTAARALIKHWDSLQTADLADAEESIDALRQALEEPDELLEIAREIVLNAEEYDFDDGLGMGISMDLYDRLASVVEPPNSTTNVVEPYNGWELRKVYFEDGEPLMHSEPENTQAQELCSNTEQLEAEIKRLQELADYRLKLLTKMPSEWVGLTDEDIEELRRNGAHSVSDADFRAIEVRLKELNNA